jgi:hypothetical protein
MPDETQDPNEAPEPAEDAPADDPEDADAPILAQADNPDAVKRALKAERDAAKRAAKERDEALARVKEFEDRDKSEQERLAERASALEADNAKLARELLRLEVAAEKKLPPELARRLQGDDREALEADAEALLAIVTTTNAPRGSADQGARKGGNNQLTEADLKSMTPEAIVEARKAGRFDALLGVSK